MGIKRVLLSAVVFGLSLGLLWLDARRTDEQLAQSDRASKLLHWPADEIVSIKIMRTGQPLELRLKGAAWHIVQPIESPADQQAVGDLLYYLTEQRKYGERPLSRKRMEQFGLKNPPLSFSVSAGEGKTLDVLVGNQSPVYTEVYAANRDSASFFTIGRTLKERLRRPLIAYRDKSILPFNANDATTISFTTAGRTVQLARVGDGDNEGWQILRPFKAKAEDESIDQILRDVQSTRASDFQDTDTLQLDLYGLAAPSVVAIFETDSDPLDGSESDQQNPIQRATLLIGNPVGEGSRKRYAMRADRDTVFQLPQTLVSLMELNPLDLRSGDIFTLAEADVAHYELSYDESSVAVERGSDGVWQFADDSPWEVDQQYASAVLSFILKIRAGRFFGFVPDNETTGLDRPFLRVTLTGTDPTRVEGIETGKMGDGPRTKGMVYAKKLDAAEVFGIPRDRSVKLFLTIEKFRDKTVLDFAPADVAVMTLKGQVSPASPSFAFVFERTPQAYWLAQALPDGESFNVGGHLVESMILGARNLRWTKILNPAKPGDRKRIDLYELDKAPLVIEFHDRENNLLGFLAIGNQTKGDSSRGLVYLRAGDAENSQYLTLEANRFAGFSGALAELLKP